MGNEWCQLGLMTAAPARADGGLSRPENTQLLVPLTHHPGKGMR